MPEDTSFNILNNLYYYNGGGVAAGDVNSDGLPDLYFTSNREPDRLYLNRGDFRFEDVTERAGVGNEPGWTTGVTMADVNGDGHLDIYVSGVKYRSMDGRNVLYINDGDGTFTERTKEFGLEHEGYSTQALFFDYDNDGDLDMYLLNYSVHGERGPSSAPQRSPRHPRAGDRLFRNDSNRFSDVSERAGIYGGVEGYGLGVVASDFDMDGCIDLFVANDFQENDFLYLNNCDGSFTESIASATRHTSRFSMGVDAADFNNDLRPDLMVLDMLPERDEILKTAATSEPFELFDARVKAGYHPQYSRNTLQLNRGGTLFSDIGYLAGVSATDWSWSALFADFDNDGLKDLFVTNGIYRRPNDLDYLTYVVQPGVQRSLSDTIRSANLALLERMPQVPLSNYLFRNAGDLTFTNVAEPWGLGEPGFSNGAAFADLDNDGALDLVVNNVNGPASIYRNRARDVAGNHFLVVQLRGAKGNTSGIGAKVVVQHGAKRQLVEQMPTRGFQSSVDHRLHFGMGADAFADTVTVVWPDGRAEIRANVGADTMLVFDHAAASAGPPAALLRTDSAGSLFNDVTSSSGLDFRHREIDFFDHRREPLMPHLLSREGPALAVADVNGDGREDIFVGGAKWQPAALYLQTSAGSFQRTLSSAFRADSLAEDVDAAFFDADGDGDRDLYVVSAGNEFWGNAEALRDRLYLNDGRGSFTRARGALPDVFENGSCVAAADYDNDGDFDLFVGSRVTARQYGVIPRSYVLENDGLGNFRDAGLPVAQVGMVSDAAWADLDGDGRPELVVVGEWMPVRVFGWREGGEATRRSAMIEDRTDSFGFKGTEGWWNSVTASDLDGDGDTDLVIGNLGLNSYIKAAPNEPARLYVHDFGQTGTLKQILTTYRNGVSLPLAGRDDITANIPATRAQFPTYASYAGKRLADIVPAAELRAATVFEAKTFATSVAINNGDGTFQVRPLPVEAQFAPVYAALASDFDGDGRVDVLLGGNFSGVTPARGHYDASYGLLLRGNGAGGFTAMDMQRSGIRIAGEVRDLDLVQVSGRSAVAVARNDDGMLVLELRSSSRSHSTTNDRRGPR
ncbi:MAG: VCBS repeat-containing protein [Gemmatimonadaceae bacterium]